MNTTICCRHLNNVDVDEQYIVIIVYVICNLNRLNMSNDAYK